MKNYTRFAIVLMLASPTVALAASPEPAGGVVTTPAAPASLATPDSQTRYDLPWQLRPVAAANVVRVDSAAAVFNDANGNLDEAFTTVAAASHRITPDWAFMVRLGFVGNDAPGAALDGSSFVNPIVGATHLRSMGSYRLALFGAASIPVGTGGGDGPNVGAAKTNAASMTARPADQAMFAVNYMTAIAGADFAYVNHGFTAQGEVTLQPSVRVRGAHSAAAADAFRTSAAVGLHLGSFMGSHFSLGADLLYQRWLSRTTVAATDTLTAAAGPRLHFKLGRQGGIHPGLSFVRGFDRRGFGAPLLTAQTTAVQIDVPVMF